MVWYGMVWYGMVWYGMVWYGMAWYGMVCYGPRDGHLAELGGSLQELSEKSRASPPGAGERSGDLRLEVATSLKPHRPHSLHSILAQSVISEENLSYQACIIVL